MADDSRTLILKFQAEIETARQQLKVLSDATGTTATKIDVDLSKLEASFDRTNKGISVKALALATTIGSAFGSLVGNALGQIPYALERIATGAVQSAASIKNTADALGISTDALQDFRIGASKAGVETSKADAALDQFQQTSGKAASGNKESAAAFKAVGVNIADANGNLKPFEQRLGEVADGLAKLPDPAVQSAAAIKLFGSNGDALLPFLRGGSQGINDLAAASEALGLKLSPETIKRLDELGNKSEDIKRVIDAQLAAAIGENADAFLALGNAAETAIEGVAGLLRQMQGIKLLVARGDLVSLIGKSADELAALGTPQGRLAYADAKLASFKGRAPETIADAQKFRDEQFDLALNDKYPLAGPRSKSGGAVIAPAGKAPKVAKAAKATKAPFDFDTAYSELLKTPATTTLSKDDAGLDQFLNNPTAFLNPTKAAEKLGDTLRTAFDTKNLDDLVQTIPDLTADLKQSDEIGQQFLSSFTYGLVNAIDQTSNLGDIAVQTFKRIGLELLESGLLSFLSGGKQGTSFGTLAKGIGSLFSGKGFAEGGSPPVGQFSVVGERGPELFMPKSAGTIIPNDRLGGRSTVYAPVINVDARGATDPAAVRNQARLAILEAAPMLNEAIGGSTIARLKRPSLPGGGRS